MKIQIDTDEGKIVQLLADGTVKEFDFDTPQAFALISQAWLRVGWDAKHVYSFSWMGRPLIQLPEDVLRIQEVIYKVKPDVLIETGIAHGGSLVFYASLFRAIGKGRVVGVDIEIRPHNRAALENHELISYISLIEGSSIAPSIVDQVRQHIRAGESVMVVLDSNHSKEHVLAELELYGPLVTEGSYIVATDGIMKDLVGAPRANDDWNWNNPSTAAQEFAASHPEFELEAPAFTFNEGIIKDAVTYWPNAWLRRIA